MTKKVLIFGPMGDFGGRELEAAFIAHALSEKYVVDICSSTSFTKKSQLFDFNKEQSAFSLNTVLIKNHFSIKLFATLSHWKNRRSKDASFFAKNYFTKTYLGYNKKIRQVFETLIPEYDLVLICAQLSSKFVADVVDVAAAKGTKVLFRTTGANDTDQRGYIDKVDCFIHHSQKNAEKLMKHQNHQYTIIDQCAYSESELIKILPVQNKVKKFLTLARLVSEKNIDVVIEAFKKAKTPGDQLIVIGSGPETEHLVSIAGGDADIVFTGFIPNHETAAFFAEADCIIISYYELETGPLTGIEAMAAGRLLISTQAGAMPERIAFNPFWFENTIDSLSEQIMAIKKLDAAETLHLSEKIRARYIESYSMKSIKMQYLNTVDKALQS